MKGISIFLLLIAVTIPREGSWFCERMWKDQCGVGLKNCQNLQQPKERNVDFYCVTNLKVRNNVKVEE